MKQKFKSYLEMILIAAAVAAADQYTKYLIRSNLALGESFAPIESLGSFFRIVHWKNTGVAFGLFQGHGWVFTLVGLLMVLLIFIFYVTAVTRNAERAVPSYALAALSLELGGALGNLIDRLNPDLGYVVDFLWFGSFPVFNLADTAIVIGAFLLIIYIFNEEKKEKAAEAVKQEGLRE